MKHIDKEEKELIKSYKRGEWKPVKNADKKNYEQAAKESLGRNSKMNEGKK